MDNSNIAPNWFRLHEANEELALLEQLGDGHQANHAVLLRQKVSQCKDLKARLEQDEG
jgi:hypothetical protein